MKHTEEELTTVVQKILRDVNFKYHEDKPFGFNYTEDTYFFKDDSTIERGVVVSIDWYDAEYLGGNDVTAFLIIDDDTGEPEIFHVRSGGGGDWVIKKDDDGKYFVESNY